MTPYTIERLYPGKLKISSYIFKHLHHPEDAIRAYFSRFTGVKKVRYYKNAGRLVIEYDPEDFDLIEFINTLENTKREILLEDISKEKVSQPARESSSRWLAITSLGFIPYLLRGVIPNYALAGITLICAKPLFEKFLRSLRSKNLDVHFLDSSAVVLASLTGNPLSAHTMVFLLALGDYLAERVEKKAYSQIEKLFSYREDRAWLVTGNGQAVRVKAMDLKEGDLVVVYAGEKVPADGSVEEGEALINQASLTGESNPVHKKKGDKVYAGTYLEDGKIYVRVESAGENTTIAKIARIVEESIKEPINIQRRAEEFANRFVLPTVALALGSYLSTGQLSRLSSTLIIDYHTGVHLTTPLAVLSAVAHASSFGILIKSGSKLETLSRTDTFVLDKTGTLTVGSPSIEDVVGIELPDEEVLLYAASLDQRITHPVAKAIVKLAQSNGMELIPRENSQYHIGMGIEGELQGTRFMLGSTRFMQKKKVKIGQEIRQLVDKFHSEAKSVLYLVREKTIVGLLTFRDPIREEAKDVVAQLKKMGKRVVLCTGDNEGVAKYMAQMLGIDEYYARVFPAEKAQLVQRLQQEGRVVAFVGDGVNDSPALSVANVGISLRSGTDIAIEVADIVIGDSLWHLVDVIDIAHETLSKLRNIYALNTLFNTVGLMGAVSGLAGPGLSTLINNGSTLLLGLYATKKPKRR
ncbi:MAG: heavy metal translocating P-type ATPase [Hydrogenobacter thermophilus]|uniref:heavy metal translocating P-type ATPase n=1 Tax=Hydrogenobacter thermophilus TaxID=940 RepID=UPI001C740AD8|nr:heavy metal translocating P-type ATPase [Hydrogenobacter thermophilus]QWK20167.1 MAG: heavy metal translocating P-type ATPase [Hydrogenobacter thermophilus]